jgi:hypothetical protein
MLFDGPNMSPEEINSWLYRYLYGAMDRFANGAISIQKLEEWAEKAKDLMRFASPEDLTNILQHMILTRKDTEINVGIVQALVVAGADIYGSWDDQEEQNMYLKILEKGMQQNNMVKAAFENQNVQKFKETRPIARQLLLLNKFGEYREDNTKANDLFELPVEIVARTLSFLCPQLETLNPKDSLVQKCNEETSLRGAHRLG